MEENNVLQKSQSMLKLGMGIYNSVHVTSRSSLDVVHQKLWSLSSLDWPPDEDDCWLSWGDSSLIIKLLSRVGLWVSAIIVGNVYRESNQVEV